MNEPPKAKKGTEAAGNTSRAAVSATVKNERLRPHMAEEQAWAACGMTSSSSDNACGQTQAFFIIDLLSSISYHQRRKEAASWIGFPAYKEQSPLLKII
jgi:hypothetical protein